MSKYSLEGLSKRSLNENVSNKKIICPAYEKQEYARRSDRPPLGNLQSVAQKHLTVEYGQNTVTSQRSKSLSGSVSKTRSSSKERRPVEIALPVPSVPTIKPPLGKLPQAVVRQRTSSSTTIQSSHSSQPTLSRCGCRCAVTESTLSTRKSSSRGNTLSNLDVTKYTKEYQTPYSKENDEVFMPALSSTVYHQSSKQKEQNIQRLVCVDPTTLKLKTQRSHSSDSRASNQSSKVEKDALVIKSGLKATATKSFRGQPVSSSTRYQQASKQTEPKIQRLVCVDRTTTVQGTTLKTKRSHSSDSGASKEEKIAKEALVIKSGCKATTSKSFQGGSSHSQKTTKRTPSTHTVTSQKINNQSKKASQATKTSHYVTSSSEIHHTEDNNERISTNGRSSTTSTKPVKGFLTLPSQQFMTLTQDTLQTTTGSETSSSIQLCRNVKFNRDSSFVSTDEEVPFTHGAKYFEAVERGKVIPVKSVPVASISPFKISVPVRRKSSISEQYEQEHGRRPAVKKTLKRRSSTQAKRIHYPLLYSPEYIEDVITYMYDHRTKFLLKNHTKLEVYVDKRYRTYTVNWLLKVTQQIVPNFEPVFYMTVRILDFTIIALKLRISYYQLAAAVSLWISTKYLISNVHLEIPKIFSMCNGRSSKEEILSTERKILLKMQFMLNIPDPLDFLHFYLKLFNMENNEILKYSSSFVMECVALYENFCLLEAPFLAACAIYLAYQTMHNNKLDKDFIWFNQKQIEEYVKNVVVLNVNYTLMEKYEPVNKYLTEEKMCVARLFIKRFNEEKLEESGTNHTHFL